MKKHLPALGLALLLIGLLALIISGTIGSALVVPLLLLAWVAQVLYQSIHQALLWAVFVLLAMLLVATSFPWNNPALPLIKPYATAQGRVANWAGRIAASKRDDYSRWRLAQRLAQLTIDTLAFREQCSAQEITRRLNNGSLDIPPQLRAYLYAGNMSYAPKFKQIRRFGRPSHNTARPDPLAIDPQLVIDYLEQTLQHTTGAS